MTPKTPDSPSGPTLGVLADSFRRALLAENKSPKTVMTYLDAVTTLEAYLRAKRLPTAVDRITKTFCLDFIADQLALIDEYDLRESKEPDLTFRTTPALSPDRPARPGAPASVVAIDLADDFEPRAQEAAGRLFERYHH